VRHLPPLLPPELPEPAVDPSAKEVEAVRLAVLRVRQDVGLGGGRGENSAAQQEPVQPRGALRPRGDNPEAENQAGRAREIRRSGFARPASGGESGNEWLPNTDRGQRACLQVGEEEEAREAQEQVLARVGHSVERAQEKEEEEELRSGGAATAPEDHDQGIESSQSVVSLTEILDRSNRFRCRLGRSRPSPTRSVSTFPTRTTTTLRPRSRSNCYRL
jgi:hypothetical protein